MTEVRAFIAIELPESTLSELAALTAKLKCEVHSFRWTRPEALHLTLKFIGEVAPERFEELADSMGRDFADGDMEPLTAELGIALHPRLVGAFPSPERARVLWAGLGGEVARLATLTGELEGRLEKFDIPREVRPFRPHLTVGRCRGKPRDLSKVVRSFREFKGGTWRAERLVLFESRLKPGGAEHTPRAELKFA